MHIGTYLVETPGSSLDINVLTEIEAVLNLLTMSNINFPDGIDEDVILSLYDYVSTVTIMRNEGILNNLPMKAKQAGRAFYNAAALLKVIVPIIIFNYDLIQ